VDAAEGQLSKSTPALPVAEAVSVSAKGMQILREKGAVRGIIYKTAGRDPLRSPEWCLGMRHRPSNPGTCRLVGTSVVAVLFVFVLLTTGSL